MYKLKNDNKINHLVFSVFVNGGQNKNYSSIKFGSYDELGIEKGHVLNVYKTTTTKNWELMGS